MVVVPGTSIIHAETFAKALGCEVVVEPKAGEEWAFFVGIAPTPLVAKFKQAGYKVVAYWIGSDSLSAIQDANYRAAIDVYDVHLCVHERIQEELKAWGINAYVVWPCARNYYKQGEVPPHAKEKCVGVYSPTPGDDDLYLHPMVVQIAREHPNLKFMFYGSKDGYQDLPANCIDAGRMAPEQTKDLYAQFTCILRLCRHDGHPVGGIEAKIRNMHVIENFPYPGFLYAHTLEDVHRFLKDEEVHKADLGPWPAYYRERCSPENFKDQVYKLIDLECNAKDTEGILQALA